MAPPNMPSTASRAASRNHARRWTCCKAASWSSRLRRPVDAPAMLSASASAGCPCCLHAAQPCQGSPRSATPCHSISFCAADWFAANNNAYTPRYYRCWYAHRTAYLCSADTSTASAPRARLRASTAADTLRSRAAKDRGSAFCCSFRVRSSATSTSYTLPPCLPLLP